jgi:hypothetical protein
MNGYHELTDDEINYLQKQLIEPNLEYPHYLPLVIDNIIIHECRDIKPLINEKFYEKTIYRRNGEKIISVSNYGRISYNNAIITPYIVGTFLHCLKVYHKDFGDHNVYDLVKETIDPIENRANYEIHHINNNALDNRLENLIWVTKNEHRKIDNAFNSQLCAISKKIYKNNRENLTGWFNKNLKKYYSGKDILLEFKNVYCKVIKDNIRCMVENRIIKEIVHGKFEENEYILIE